MSVTLPPPEWNQTDREYPEVMLPEASMARAALDPEAPAVRFRDESLTYGELEARVAALARRLCAMGVAGGTPVAVCMERSIELVVALHAILRSGGAYVPIDPEYPDERISLMLDDLDEPILLTQRRLSKRLGGASARVVPVDASPSAMAPAEPMTLPRVDPDDLAYVIYTSGSTGRPKGAMITHRAIANRIYWMQEQYGLAAGDKVLQKTPFSFDVSVWEFFWPLLVGAELVVAEPGGHRDSSYLANTIIEQGITTVHFVPSMLQAFLDDPAAAECVSLQRVICSGEALPRALQDRFFSVLGAELHNLYGPTEAAVDVTAWQCDPQSQLPFVPIGKPIANTQMHILDDDLRPVPVGTAGELHIGGVQVGRGYLNRPELTQERFIGDPFRSGGTLYKTGDLARYRPDGSIEFLGRSDFQVKIRGFRVELGEIEAALDALDGVRGSVVVAHERADGDVELVAYIAHPAGDGLVLGDVRRQLGQRLPEYMVPSRYVVVPRFPLTSSGKVDRKALPPPGRIRPQSDAPYVPPSTELERVLSERWRDLLEVDRVGIHDRFFELGGTSLQAARFVTQLQAELGVPLSVTTIFDAPTIAEYASDLQRDHPQHVASLLHYAGSATSGEAAAAAAPGSSTATADDRLPTLAGHRRGTADGRAALTGQRARKRAARTRDSSSGDDVAGG